MVFSLVYCATTALNFFYPPYIYINKFISVSLSNILSQIKSDDYLLIDRFNLVTEWFKHWIEVFFLIGFALMDLNQRIHEISLHKFSVSIFDWFNLSFRIKDLCQFKMAIIKIPQWDWILLGKFRYIVQWDLFQNLIVVTRK